MKQHQNLKITKNSIKNSINHDHIQKQSKSQNQIKINQVFQPIIFSQAYPVLNQKQFIDAEKNNQNIIRQQVHSSVHQKLKKLNFTLQKHSYPILLRKWKVQDLIQLRKLQTQWFPIRYGDQFYAKIQRNQAYCMIRYKNFFHAYRRNIEIEIVDSFQDSQIKIQKYFKNRNNYIQNQFIYYLLKYKVAVISFRLYFVIAQTIIDPQQFIQKNLNTNYSELDNKQRQKLFKQQQNPCNEQTSSNKQVNKQSNKQKIIVGAAVFSFSDSQGYVSKSWMKFFVSIFTEIQDSIYLMTLGVIDEFRKKGVGKMLINQVLQTIKNQVNLKLVYLHVVSYNKPAINFYKKIGFLNLDHLSNFYHISGKQYDAQVYGLFLNQGKPQNGWTIWLKKLFR